MSAFFTLLDSSVPERLFRVLANLVSVLALYDEAQGHGLHTPGGDAALHSLPQQGRDLVAHEAVEHAARLLGIEKMGIDIVRVFQSGLDRTSGNFVELDTLDIISFLLDDFGDVPGDGFTFAVRVGREEDGLGFGRRFLQILHDFFFALDDLIARGEVVFFVHGDLTGRQVTDVACTIYLLPRNFLMVFTLAGDSTMMRSLPIFNALRSDLGWRKGKTFRRCKENTAKRGCVKP